MTTPQKLQALGFNTDLWFTHAGYVVATKGGCCFTAGDIITQLFKTNEKCLAELQRFLDLLDRARVPGEITQTREGIQQLRDTIAEATRFPIS